MKFRQKPNGMWLVDYEDGTGARRRVSTGIKTAPTRTAPPDVKAAGRDIVLGLRAPTTPTAAAPKARKEDGRLTMSGLFDKCEATVWHPDNARAQATIRSNLKYLRERIGDVAVEDMTFSRLEQLVAEMKASGAMPATIKRKLDMVSKALRMATMWSDEQGRPLLSYKPPMPTVVVNNLKDRTISRAEEEAIFVAIEKRRQTEPARQWRKFAALIRFLFATGGRLGESLILGPHSVKEMAGQSYVTFPRYRTKSGKPRTVPLTPDAIEALGGLMQDLTLDKATGEWRFFAFTSTTAWYMFSNIRDDVKAETGLDLSDVTLHTVRHTTLTRLAQGGMGLAQLQQWAGHSDPKITAERYVHLMPSDLVGGLSILGTAPTRSENQERFATRPVIVPSTIAAGIGATVGTPRLQ